MLAMLTARHIMALTLVPALPPPCSMTVGTVPMPTKGRRRLARMAGPAVLQLRCQAGAAQSNHQLLEHSKEQRQRVLLLLRLPAAQHAAAT